MEDLSELTDLTQQLNEKLQFRIEQVRSDMARLQEEKAEFEAEKEVMQCLTSQESDIIKLNVRGKLMETRRTTLCQVSCVLILLQVEVYVTTSVALMMFVCFLR